MSQIPSERMSALVGRAKKRLGLGDDRTMRVLRSSQRAWEGLARQDPLWAVLTDASKQGGRWNEGEFFATGEREIARVFAHLQSRGIEIDDRSLALDFGCGVGRLTRALGRRFAEVHGVDASPTMIEKARALDAGVGGRSMFVLNQAPDLGQLASARYAFIYSSIVLQHIPYPASLGYVREFLRLAKPGGWVVFQTPTQDRTGVLRRTLRATAIGLARRTQLPIRALQMEMHVIPELEIRRYAAAAGFDVLDVVSTNSVAPDTNGALEFFTDDRGDRLISKQFALRKR